LTDNILRSAIESGYLSTSIINSNQVGQIRFILVGLALMLLMIFRPQGIFGDRKELALDGR
jgi:branched-chain amino acid transport system permease protein